MNQLKIIALGLEQLERACNDPDLQSAYAVILELQQNKKAASFIDLENYKRGSHTFLRNSHHEKDFQQLQRAHDWITGLFAFNLSSDLLTLNALVTDSAASFRQIALDAGYPFPDASSIAEGLSLILDYERKTCVNPLFQKVALIQALLSLHPFLDGNHRSMRLLLDYWLLDLNLPTLYLENVSDFLMANPTNRQVYSLKHAITLVLFAMEARLQKDEDFIG